MRQLAGREVRGIFVLSIGTILLYLAMALAEVALHENASFSSAFLAPQAVVGAELGVYFAATIGQLILYVLVVARYARSPSGSAARSFLLATPIIVMCGLMLVPPMLSIDVLSYLAHGATGLLSSGANAYSVAPATVLRLPIGQALLDLGWNPPPAPSPYGPLWTVIEAAVVHLIVDPIFGVYVFKLVALLASLGSACLLWRILAAVRPKDQLRGTVLYLWNPVILVELTGEGHNDALMAFLALLGIYATLQLWTARGIVATALGGLIKYLPLLTLMPELVYLWRTRRGAMDLLRGVTLGAAISIAITAGLYALFWGPTTLDGVLHSTNGGPWPIWPTIPGVLYAALLGWSPSVDAAQTKGIVIDALFGIFLLIQSVRVRDAQSLVTATANIAIVYALVVSPVYWPWYAVLPITFVVLTPTGSSVAVVVAFSIGSRIAAPLADLPSANDPSGSPWEWLTLASIVATAVIFVVAQSGLLARLYGSIKGGGGREPDPLPH
jgi:hypothetical protein